MLKPHSRLTAANVHDNHPLPDLLHGQETQVYGDSAYASQQAPIASKAPNARHATNQRVRPGGPGEDIARLINRSKSRVRSKVEHVFAVVKRLWGFNKARYRGWPRMQRGHLFALGWPTSTWRGASSMDECACMARG